MRPTRGFRLTKSFLFVVGWLLAHPMLSDAGTVVVTIGGRCSDVGCNGMATLALSLQWRLQAAREGVAGSPLIYGMPCNVLDWAAYARVEDAVENSLRRILARGDAVILIGYSSGATAALRVLDQLRTEPSRARITLVTIDRIAFGYPLDPLPDPTPTGLARAFALYQAVDVPAIGGGLRPAANVPLLQEEVGLDVLNENRKWRELVPDQKVCAEPLPDAEVFPGLHSYMQYSLLVRRKALQWLGFQYGGGIWDFRVTGSFTYSRNASLPLPGGVSEREPFVVQELTTQAYPLLMALRRDGSKESYVIVRLDDSRLVQSALSFVDQCTASSLQFGGNATFSTGFDELRAVIGGNNIRNFGQESYAGCDFIGVSRFDGELSGVRR